MKLIVGLGNPGIEYKNTRHNIGFMVIDNYAESNKLSFKNKFNGLYSSFNYKNDKVILLKPQTYMNLSGDCVLEFVNYFNVDLEDVFVIYDDINFEVGNYKIKKDGSSGGHNGINDIIKKLKTEKIKRLKIGISKNVLNLKDYVLSDFNKYEFETINKLFEVTNNIIDDYLKLDFEKLMSKYNGNKNEK